MVAALLRWYALVHQVPRRKEPTYGPPNKRPRRLPCGAGPLRLEL